MKQIMLLSLLFCHVFQVWGDEWKDGEGMTWMYFLSGSNAVITGSSIKSVDLIIPDTINGYKVTCIGNFAFNGRTGIKQLTLPEGLEKICSKAFNNCSGLKTIYLPSSIVTIEDEAFAGCTSLKEVHCLACTPPTIDKSSFNTFPNNNMGISKNHATLYVPAIPTNALSLYQAHEYWSKFKEIVQLQQASK